MRTNIRSQRYVVGWLHNDGMRWSRQLPGMSLVGQWEPGHWCRHLSEQIGRQKTAPLTIVVGRRWRARESMVRLSAKPSK
jgi:hypothetical protein